ncbi:MAG: hypothetical protein R3E12_10155 [Candidatus Eisenbacteria bacterium]
MDPVDRDRGFRDVGRHDDAGSGAGADGALLLFGREVPVEWEEIEPPLSGQRIQSAQATPDLPRARHEDEHGCGEAVLQQMREGERDRLFHGRRLGRLQVVDLDRMLAPGNREHGYRIEVPLQGIGLQGRRHHDQP